MANSFPSAVLETIIRILFARYLTGVISANKLEVMAIVKPNENP